MARGSPQFSPEQLLDAGRRAEAEGKLDLALKFYGHLTDHYGQTSEAAEGRRGLARIGGAAPGPQVWQMNGAMPAATELNGKLSGTRERRARYAPPRANYRLGRVLAALFSGIGWLVVAVTGSALAVTAAAEFIEVTALESLRLGSGTLPHAAGALLAGALALLLGQAARALFDQASATQELAAIERARIEGEQL